jgi:uncharacterized protein
LIVVSDTSPIRALEFLGLLRLLGDLFDGVLIPPKVWDELSSPLPRFDTVDLTKYDFITVQVPQDQKQVQEFSLTLDRGESEALTLALETGTRIVLMDERKGRALAAEYNIVALGTLGVLLRSKSRGLIPAIKPHIEKLFDLGFFMSAELRDSVLRLADE